jgi:hypothetical protein
MRVLVPALFFHRFYGFYHHFGTTRRADVYFATCAGKTVAARPGHVEVGKPKTTRRAEVNLFFFRAQHQKMVLISRNNPKLSTWVKMMAAPEGILSQ